MKKILHSLSLLSYILVIILESCSLQKPLLMDGKKEKSKSEKSSDMSSSCSSSSSLIEEQIHNAYTSAYQGDLTELKELVKQGCDINLMNKKGELPMYVAIKANRIDIIGCLLESSYININEAVEDSGYNALQLAIEESGNYIVSPK